MEGGGQLQDSGRTAHTSKPIHTSTLTDFCSLGNPGTQPPVSGQWHLPPRKEGRSSGFILDLSMYVQYLRTRYKGAKVQRYRNSEQIEPHHAPHISVQVALPDKGRGLANCHTLQKGILICPLLLHHLPGRP